MSSKAILYDLGIAGVGITLWLTPLDISRAVGYSLSLLFSGHAYLTGISLIHQERKNDEKEGIAYEAETDFYERLLESHIDSQLEIIRTEIETNTLKKIIPYLTVKRQLESEFHQVDQNSSEVIEAEEDTSYEDMRLQFAEEMDGTYWKAILKALQEGVSREEIIKDVLGCNQSSEAIGREYFEYLKRKFL